MNLEESATSRWFADEVQVHAGALRAWLGSRYPQLSDPDNVVQESLTRVWRVGQAGGVRSPKALLFTTASHLALDELRRRKIVPFETLGNGDAESVIEEGEATPETVAHREELELLTQAIQSLPTRCREALTLRALGYSYKQIGAELAISQRAVEDHLTRGLRACGKFLARHGLP